MPALFFSVILNELTISLSALTFFQCHFVYLFIFVVAEGFVLALVSY